MERDIKRRSEEKKKREKKKFTMKMNKWSNKALCRNFQWHKIRAGYFARLITAAESIQQRRKIRSTSLWRRQPQLNNRNGEVNRGKILNTRKPALFVWKANKISLAANDDVSFFISLYLSFFFFLYKRSVFCKRCRVMAVICWCKGEQNGNIPCKLIANIK